jgi:hypothetical protein
VNEWSEEVVAVCSFTRDHLRRRRSEGHPWRNGIKVVVANKRKEGQREEDAKSARHSLKARCRQSAFADNNRATGNWKSWERRERVEEALTLPFSENIHAQSILLLDAFLLWIPALVCPFSLAAFPFLTAPVHKNRALRKSLKVHSQASMSSQKSIGIINKVLTTRAAPLLLPARVFAADTTPILAKGLAMRQSLEHQQIPLKEKRSARSCTL